MEPKKGQRYSNEFRRQAVERMRGCNNIVRLARELGVCRRVLYNWRDQLDESNASPSTDARTDVAQTNPQTQAIVSK